MKKILITGGPTNEYIDKVMKITNMSTGSFSIGLADIFAKSGYGVSLILNNSIKYKNDNVNISYMETTDELLNILRSLSKKGNKYDVIIHAAAVGDYKADFSFLMEDLAQELFIKRDKIKTLYDILKILKNPDCKLYDGSKISSYQENLTVKLTMTPKVIGELRKLFPQSLLIGCKLLENVSKENLFQVAATLAKKNNMDYIFANDLLDLRNGKQERYLVDKNGYRDKVFESFENIFDFVDRELKEKFLNKK